MLWLSLAFSLFSFLLKVRIHNLIDLPIFRTFFFLMKFHTFLTTQYFEKSLCSRNFLNTIFRTVPLFFQRRTFFLKKLFNAILPCTTLSSSLFPPVLFPPFFPFHLPYNQIGYWFPNSANKKKCSEDINKNSLNLVRTWCKIHVLHHPIRDVTSAFYLKLSTSYHN